MISRRGVVLAALASGCAKRVAPAEQFRTFLNDLPHQTAGSIPYEPWTLEGKVVLVTFIATWCFPCLADLVVLQRLQRDYGEKGFANVLVGMDLEGREVLDPFAAGYKLEYPLIVADDRLRNGETSFGRIRELPSRVLFSRSGEIAAAYAGVTTWDALNKVVQHLL
ncbi:MAG: TlpA family protein disulfide reductase [Archangium sp.]